jgi:hypothetical protein
MVSRDSRRSGAEDSNIPSHVASLGRKLVKARIAADLHLQATRSVGAVAAQKKWLCRRAATGLGHAAETHT